MLICLECMYCKMRHVQYRTTSRCPVVRQKSGEFLTRQSQRIGQGKSNFKKSQGKKQGFLQSVNVQWNKNEKIISAIRVLIYESCHDTNSYETWCETFLSNPMRPGDGCASMNCVNIGLINGSKTLAWTNADLLWIGLLGKTLHWSSD